MALYSAELILHPVNQSVLMKYENVPNLLSLLLFPVEAYIHTYITVISVDIYTNEGSKSTSSW